jgi:hypothetical protein
MGSLDPKVLVGRCRSEHVCAPGAAQSEIEAAEGLIGAEMPGDLRDLYAAMNGARFWTVGDLLPCRLLALREIAPPFGKAGGPSSLVAIMSLHSDYLGVDLASASPGRILYFPIETFPEEVHEVCDSVWDVVSMILDGGGRDWLLPAVKAYSKRRRSS